MSSTCSLAKYKTDINYLEDDEKNNYYNELLLMKMVSFFYKPGLGYDDSKRIGFLIDDNEESVIVNSDGESVNMYNYIGLAVIALQKQNEKITNQEKRIDELEKRISALEN